MTDATFDFGPMIDANVARFTVGFITLSTQDPRPLGSGTLVKASNTQGILTCAHVLHALSQHTNIGVLLFPANPTKVQQLSVGAADLTRDAIEFSDRPYSADGRDLAYLPISRELMASLSASASILDLDLHEERTKGPRPDGAQSFEVISGIVNEMTPPASVEADKLVLRCEGLLNVGRVIDTREFKAFDLLEFEPKPATDFKVPTSYGATSGGGIWRLYVRSQGDGSSCLVQSRLVGVVFWQTDGPNRNLIGHGPISLYGHLLPAIRSRFGSS